MKRKLLFAGLTMFVGLSIVLAVKANSNAAFRRDCCQRTTRACTGGDEFITGPYLLNCGK